MKLALSYTMLGILLMAAPAAAQGSANAPKPVPNAIVKIRAIHNHPNFVFPWQRRGAHTVTGSGVIVDGGRILTNAHVVEDHTIIEPVKRNIGVLSSDSWTETPER